MRIFACSLILCFAALPAQAQVTSETKPLPTVIRTGQIPTVPEGLEIKIFSDRAGDVHALALSPNGEILALDKRSGRVRALRDRDGDGRAETVRPLADGFRNPSYLSVYSDTAYVFDGDGLWALDLTEISPEPEQAVELSTRGGLPFIAQKGAWFIGMPGLYEQEAYIARVSQTDLTAQIDSTINVSMMTLGAGGEFWTAYYSAHDDGTRIGRIGGTGQAAPSDTVSALASPSQDVDIDEALDGLIIALPNIGQVGIAPFKRGGIDKVTPLISGFQNDTERALWGRPTALVFDKTGALLIGDSANGIIWRVAGQQEAALRTGPKTVDLTTIKNDVGDKPSLALGSSIARGDLGQSGIENKTLLGGSQDPKLRQPDLWNEETFKDAMERETDDVVRGNKKPRSEKSKAGPDSEPK